MLGPDARSSDNGEVINLRVATLQPAMSRRYAPPKVVGSLSLHDALTLGGRPDLESRQLDLLKSGQSSGEVRVYYAGDISLLRTRCVSIVGTREVSEAGKRRALRLARELASRGVTVVSGLARGVDTAAHTGSLEGDGRTIAIIGTPLNKAYPIENAMLQEIIFRDNLLISPFAAGEVTFKSNFPKRNRVMAALTDATVIVEASDTSGTLHQAAECQKLGRWLFIMRSVAEDRTLGWPKKFIGKDRVSILNDTSDIISAISNQ